MILPDSYEVADTLAALDYDLEAALEAHGVPFDLADRGIAALVEEALNLAEEAHRRLTRGTSPAALWT